MNDGSGPAADPLRAGAAAGPGGSAGGNTGDDAIQPFLIDGLNLNGRLVRLGAAADAIVARHDYPAPIAAMLAETLALAATLAASIKYDGIFTLQAQGDGPLRLLVADVTADGHLRAYASLDRAKYDALSEKSPANPVPRFLGAGHLAFTVDQRDNTERYQGIVELVGATLAECAQHYFRQSEQIDTVIRLAVGKPGGTWRAGGLMVQRLPLARATPGGEWNLQALEEDEREDDWRRVAILVGTVKDVEILDPALSPETLLYRLFHEDGVRVYPRRGLIDRCRCSRDRAATTLRMLDRAELAEAKVPDPVHGDAVIVTCQFCNRHEHFTDGDLDRIFAAGAGAG